LHEHERNTILINNGPKAKRHYWDSFCYSGFPSYSKAEDVAATFLTLISNIQALIFLFFFIYLACRLGHGPKVKQFFLCLQFGPCPQRQLRIACLRGGNSSEVMAWISSLTPGCMASPSPLSKSHCISKFLEVKVGATRTRYLLCLRKHHPLRTLTHLQSSNYPTVFSAFSMPTTNLCTNQWLHQLLNQFCSSTLHTIGYLQLSYTIRYL
jgi:hypothetical protein